MVRKSMSLSLNGTCPEMALAPDLRVVFENNPWNIEYMPVFIFHTP